MKNCFSKETTQKLIFITIFFIVGFTIEFFYRKPLFDNSVSIAKAVQDSFRPSATFFKYYAFLGVGEFYLAIVFFICFPITYCITCEPVYGNPSGHSFQFTSNLLAFAQMFIDLFKLRKKSCIIIYVICGILILSINFSRIVLGVHSLNQVIFGDTLGFTVYFIICKIIQPHKISEEKFFNVFLTLKFHIFNIIAIIINAISLTIAAIVNDKMESEKYEILKKGLEDICKSTENGMLSRDAKTKFLYIFAYYGMILGITLLTYYVKNKYHGNYFELNYYYKNSQAKCFIKYLTRFLFTIICYVPQFAIYTNKKINIYVIYILGSAFPMFIFGFLLFSVNYILTIEFNLANSQLYTFFVKKEENTDYVLGEIEETE